jgi:BirA family biotin operon repressor/biotin-[acetyl-CoA-carboxylase] ligase
MSAVATDRGDRLKIELIRRHLWSETFARHILLYDEVPSTNEVLRRLAKREACEGSVVIAEGQTAARGRLGTSWFSPPGVNLYASVLLRPSLPLAAVPVFSFVGSLALSEAVWLERLPAAIKWPNDILVGTRKVGGTLVECVTTGDRLDHLILGCGVNLNVTSEALAAALGAEASGATSLSAVAGRTIDRNIFAAMVLNLLEKWLQVYRTYGPEPVLYTWRERDVLTGRRVTVEEGQGQICGRALGVNHDGRFLVEEADGTARALTTARIRLLDH